MNKKNEDTNDNTLKTFMDDLEVRQELLTAIQILKEIKGIKSEDFIDKIIEAMGEIAQATSKDEFKYCPFSDLKDEKNLTKLIKFKCKIQHISDPQRLHFEGSSTDNNSINVELADLKGNTIKAVPIVSVKKKEKLQELSKGCSNLCVYGSILLGLKNRDGSVAKDINNLDYNFFIIDAEETDDLLEVKDSPDTDDLSDIKNQSNNGETNNHRSFTDKVDEMTVALRILYETEDYHESAYFNLVFKQMGLIDKSNSKSSFNFKKSISEIAENRGIPILVKFYGSIYSISSTYALRKEGTDGYIDDYMAIDLILKDRFGDTIKTIPVVTAEKRAKIKRLAENCSLFCFYGITSFGLKKGKRTKNINLDDLELRFIIMDLEPAENLLKINNYSATEITKVEKLIENLKSKNNNILNYIYTKTIKGLGIKGLNQAPSLKASIEFLVLQSFSDHTIGTRSAKLHSLIIGPPAVGKGKLAEVVQVLNYIYNAASGIRWSTAGLIAKSQSGDGLNKSDPGLIPLSHRGVFVMQDFHEAKNKRELFGIFSQVMEEGIVSDSMVSRTTHRALTSIL